MYSPLFQAVHDRFATVPRVAYIASHADAELNPAEIARYYEEKTSDTAARRATPEQAAQMEGTAGLRLTVEFEKLAPQTAVNDVRDAERAVFSVAEFLPSPYHNSTLSLRIMRAANIIAARTRRGAGNIALMHPDLIQSLTHTEWDSEQPRIGHWKPVGKLNSYIDVYVSEELPRDEVYVVYATKTEGPAFLINVDGALHYSLLPDAAAYLGNAGDYIARVEIPDMRDRGPNWID